MSHSYIIYNDNKTNNTDPAQGLVFNPPIYIETPPDYSIPEVDSTTEHIPGRNGDVVIQIEGYKNVKRSYKLTSGSETSNFIDLVRQIVSWAGSANGDYAVLMDSFDPTHFRYARFSGGVTTTNVLNHAATVEITFDCKPQNFLLETANTWDTIASDTTKTNPYSTVAKPLIKFTPTNESTDFKIYAKKNVSGAWITDRSLMIAKEAFSGRASATYYIDCENMIVYEGANDGESVTRTINKYVSCGDNYFFDLGPGTTKFVFEGASSNQIGVKYLWWTL